MIAEELKRHRQWVNWRSISRDGKPTKVPFQPSGKPAKSTDPKTWVAFEDLSDGPCGFVFAQSGPYVGIDLDGCREPASGLLDDWAKAIVLKFGSYAEVSPSGTGVKIFGSTDTFWRNKNKIELPGDGYNGKRPGIEVYDCGRYFAVTGQNLSGMTEIKDVTASLEWLADEHDMKPATFGIDGTNIPQDTPLLERASRYLAKMDPAVSGERGHDKCFKAACALVLGFGLSTDDAYHLMAAEFNPRCAPQWSPRELRHKVDSAVTQPGQRGYLADAKPAEWSKVFVRSGEAPRLEDEPEPEPEDDDSGVRRTTLRDAAMGHLDLVMSGSGALMETGIPDLDHAIGGGVALGEMIIVAARPSHGKSAIALQMIHHATANGISAVIVSEEMSALAIGKRAIQFATAVPHTDWKSSADDVLSDLETHFGEREQTMIIESCGTVDRVVQEVERCVAESGAKIVAVDYVQLLGAKGGSRYEQVTNASQELRKMASRLNIVLIVLAQLSRSIESRDKFVPIMSDLKETGQLEQDADVIVFGVYPHRINSSLSPKGYQFFIGKNRSRETNRHSFEVEFDGARQTLIEEASSIVFNAKPHSEFTEYAE